MRSIVNCPKCEARLEMPDDAPEASFICPRCQAQVVPAGESATPQTALTPLPPAAVPSAAPGVQSEPDFAGVDLRRPGVDPRRRNAEAGGFGVVGILLLLGIALLLTSGFATGRGWRGDLLHFLPVVGGGLLVLATVLTALRRAALRDADGGALQAVEGCVVIFLSLISAFVLFFLACAAGS